MSIILLLCTEYPVKQRLFKHSGFIMIRLFLVILMVLVFNFNASAQIRFYRISDTNITQEKYLFGDDKIRLTASSESYDSYTIVAKYTFYGTLIDVTIEGYRSYKQTYLGKNTKLPLQEYAKGQLLYSDGKVCEIVNKRERSLLKIKDVKLCAVYEDYSISQGLNWTNSQFENNINPNYYQLSKWETAYSYIENNKKYEKNVVFGSYGTKATISVLDVTFTNGHKVRLHIYNDPEWANAKPGMLVERFKVRQITVYKLK